MKLVTKLVLAGVGVYVVTRPEVRGMIPGLDSLWKSADAKLKSYPTAKAAAEDLMGGSADFLSAAPLFDGSPSEQQTGSGTIPPVMPPNSYLDNDGSDGYSLPYYNSRPWSQVVKEGPALA